MTETSPLSQHPFLVKVQITYTILNVQSKEEKVKEIVVFELSPESAKMPWFVLRNYSVPQYLNETVGAFEVSWQRIYEISIIKMVNRINPQDITDIPLRVMTLDQLDAYQSKWELAIDVYEFYSLSKAREMVALRLEDPLGYAKHLESYRAGKQRIYPELDSLRKQTKSRSIPTKDFDKFDVNVSPSKSDKKSRFKSKSKSKSTKKVPSKLVIPNKSQNPFEGV